MARSVALLNGKLDIFRNEDGGTTVRCSFPIQWELNDDRNSNAVQPDSIPFIAGQNHISGQQLQGGCHP
jgi:hypothetical protein